MRVQVHCHPDEDEASEAARLQEEEGRLLPHRHHLPRHLPHHLPRLQHNLLVIVGFFFLAYQMEEIEESGP